MANVFRQSALAKISSPDQLDSMLKVTTPMSWLGIAAAALLAIGVLVWAFTGSLPTTLDAGGYVVADVGTNTIYSTAQGEVGTVSVEDGERIEAGTQIATIKTDGGNTATVESSQSGVVDRVLVQSGERVAGNAELVRFSNFDSDDNVVLCFVPYTNRGQLEEGMKANVYFATGESAVATVNNIDHYVVSRNALDDIFGGEGQIAAGLESNGPVVAVTCVFEGSTIASAQLVGAEPVNVQIIVNDSAPITKVFPMLEAN